MEHHFLRNWVAENMWKIVYPFWVSFFLLSQTDSNQLKFNVEDKLHVAEDFFRLKQLSQGLVFVCSDFEHVKTLLRNCWKNYLQIGIVNIQGNIRYSRPVKKYRQVGFVLELQCLNSSNRNYSQTLGRLFTSSEMWLIIDLHNQASDFLQNQGITFDSNVLILSQRKSIWVLEEVYNTVTFRFPKKLKFVEIGTWIPKEGFVINDNRSKYTKRRNMEGLLLKSAVVLPEILKLKVPMIEFMKVEDDKQKNDVRAILRYHFRLIENFRIMFKMRFRIRRVSTWGYINNGSWEGLTGAIANDRIDISHTGLFLRADRFDVGQYSPTGTFPTQSSFVFRHPEGGAGGGNPFLRPITLNAWEATVLLLVLILLFMKLSIWVEKYYLDLREYGAPPDASLSSMSIMLVEAFTQQGMDSTPASISGRTIVASFLLFCVMFYQFYSASIISSLLMKPPKYINTLEKLLQSNLKLGMEPQVYIQEWFKLTKDPIEQKIYQEILGESKNEPPSIYNYIAGMAIALKGGFAYLTILNGADDIVGRTWTQAAICDYTKVHLRQPQRLWQHMPLASPYYQLVVIGMLTQMERGITSYETTKWQARKPQCALDLGDLTYSVRMVELMTAFGVLLLGMVLGLFILFYEVIYRALLFKRLSKRGYLE